MKHVIETIKNTKGFVSIESVLIVGAFVLVAGLIIYFVNGKAGDIGDNSEGQINKAQEKIQLDPETGVGGAKELDFVNP